MMNNEILTPVSVDHYATDYSTLDKITFSDGTTVNEFRFGGEAEPLCAISDGEGHTIPEPGAGRYPFTERLVKIAAEHYEETGTLPF